MNSLAQPHINLGFTEETFPKGTHICQIYSDDNEREATLLAYLKAGLQANERVACFSDRTERKTTQAHLTASGHDVESELASGQLHLSKSEPVYFKDNRFDPDMMLESLKAFQLASEGDNQTAARVIGEMHPRIQNVDGGDRLMEYEARVCILQETYPVTAVCQYNVDAFDGATLMNVLKVHPLMLVRGAVIRNPFYIPAAEILRQKGCC